VVPARRLTPPPMRPRVLPFFHFDAFLFMEIRHFLAVFFLKGILILDLIPGFHMV
jgi:hypothetical protein